MDTKKSSPKEMRVSQVPWQDGLGIDESLGSSSIRPLDRDATNYELRLDTEDGEALGRQYESIFAARSRAVAGESEMSFQT